MSKDYQSLPESYDELVAEYQKARAAIKLLQARKDAFHGYNDESDLRDLRAWSRRLSVAKNKHPDKPTQMDLL